MNEVLILEAPVSYRDVDRDGHALLSSLFKLLQEAAIKHADESDAGARLMTSRGESWVLHRLAATFYRYPRFEEAVRVETWSNGIQGCRGYRDFRLHAGGELLAAASSLWLYVNLRTRSVVRVPAEIATAFPTHSGDVFRSDLGGLKLAPPNDGLERVAEVSVRYSDIDANGHVNNTAYFDYLQTALGRRGLPTRPRNVEIQFAREIPPDAGAVGVHLEVLDGDLAFAIGEPGSFFALGVCQE